MSVRFRVLAVSLASALFLSLAPPAMAAAPAAPTLVGPATGSTVTTSDVPLSVRATDPDGGDLDVRFVGRKLGATVPGGGNGTPFTLVALPDTQNYTYNNRQGTIAQQAQWVVSNRSTLNTAMVVQLGDLVSNYDNLTQWGYTSTGFKVLDDAGVPNTVVAGNHDFDNATGEFSQYDSYFPPSRYAGKPWTPSTARYGGYLGQNLFGPDPVDRRNMDNFALFTAGGRDFLVLNLEWEAPQYALDWATKVLAAYPDRIAIMATHSFVNINGARSNTAERPGGTPPNAIWTNFVSQQCSIRLVLNGHFHDGNLAEANRSDLNRCGKPVQQILTDYQDRPNGGDGWLRYYTFDPAANTLKATTYSPKLNQYETDADSTFTLPFELSAPQPAPFTAIGTQRIASGDTARVTWTGLEPDTLYEWQAISDDGADTTTSPVWTVRTPASPDLVDDTFTRNVTNGWGAADATHAWQLGSGLTSYRVDGSAGRVTVPVGAGRSGTLTGVSGTDVRVTTDLSHAQAASGSGTYVSLLARVNGTASYRAELRYVAGGALSLRLLRVVSGTETTLVTKTVSGLTATPGLPLRLRLETEGTSPTALRAKVWPISAAEPAAWTATATDSTAALQVAGTAGLDLYVSSSATAAAALSFDRFTISRLGVTPPPNQKPVAAIGTPVVDGRTVDFSGAGSSDPDGTIVSYAWNFGDTTTGTGATPRRTYTADGTYTVTLTVTDDDGATDTTTRQVTVTAPPPANQAPVAAIGTPVVDGRTVDFSGAGSSDPDGTIVSYAWNFGDATTGTGATPRRTYTADGTYAVTLTVTDDDGAIATHTRDVTVAAAPPVNEKPVAAIGTPVVDGRTVDFSGAGSSDPDGTIVSYAWNFGDTTTGTGATPRRTYTADGTYTVTLTVTDDDGATDTTTRQVTVTAPPPAGVLARDAFGRTTTNGWGAADLGGTWTHNGSTTRFSVSGGTGRQTLTAPGTTADSTLTSTGSAATDLRASLAWSRTGSTGTVYGSLLARRASSSTDYRCQVAAGANGAVQLTLIRRLNGAESTLKAASIAGVTLAANQPYVLACRVVPSGTGTQLTGKFWRVGTAEPASWQATATDTSAALQAAGGIGVSSYMSSSATAPITLSVDDLVAGTP